MGGFVTGLAGAIGQKIQEHNERNIHYQHQAQEELAQQYDKMAKDAQDSGNDAFAADLQKASFGIRTTMPGQKPKKIPIQGQDMDPLDMQSIIRKHTEIEMKRQADQAAAEAAQRQGSPTLAPNGVTPQQPGQMQSRPGLFNQGPQRQSAPPQMTPPPAMGSSSPDDPADNDPWGIRK